MKIFLNDRTVEFFSSCPEQQPSATTLLTEYESATTLKTAWEEFLRYEKFRNLLIIDPGFSLPNGSAAFEAFISYFKFVPAAGGLVKNEKGEFLFIHRLGYWDLPKGKIGKKDRKGSGYPDDDQQARTAVIREVKEETGLKKVVIVKELPATWHIYSADERYFLKKTRWFEMEADSGQTLTPQTSEGIFLVKWTSPGAIHCILSHTHASLRELLLEVVF